MPALFGVQCGRIVARRLLTLDTALSTTRSSLNSMRILNEALTFDDVLLVPAESNVLPRDVTLQTQLTRNRNRCGSQEHAG